jgi:hypothetical protein
MLRVTSDKQVLARSLASRRPAKKQYTKDNHTINGPPLYADIKQVGPALSDDMNACIFRMPTLTQLHGWHTVLYAGTRD